MRARLAAASLAVLAFAVPALPRRAGAAGRVRSARFRPVRRGAVARSRVGVVASATSEATAAGARVLAAGGNAVDAAVATAFALAVTYPSAGNLAGGGFAVGRTPAGELWALDFRETAPAGTWRNIVPRAGREGAAARLDDGGLAVGTPGTVRGLEALHRRYGTLPWTRLLAPAVRLARDGFRVPPGLDAALRAVRARSSPAIPRRPAIFLAGRRAAPGGFAPRATGSRENARDDRLAGSGRFPPRRDRAPGRDFVRVDRRSPDGGGPRRATGPMAIPVRLRLRPLSARDDAAPVVGRFPARVDPRAAPIRRTGHLVPRRSGDDSPGRGSRAPRLRATATASSATSCVDVPLAPLLAPARLAALGFSIDPARATPSPAITGGAWPSEHVQTTHLSTATVDGDAVALTYTLNDTFGNRTIVPGVGVLLNNEMDDFAACPEPRTHMASSRARRTPCARAGGRSRP